MTPHARPARTLQWRRLAATAFLLTVVSCKGAGEGHEDETGGHAAGEGGQAGSNAGGEAGNIGGRATGGTNLTDDNTAGSGGTKMTGGSPRRLATAPRPLR